MHSSEKAIFTNHCMVEDGKGNILVINRQKKDWPGVTFPGGHAEPYESFVDAVIREVREETGLTIENPVLCGVKQFPTENDERYVVFCYKASRYHGTLRSSSEGEVFWIPKETLFDYDTAPDMDLLMRLYEEAALSEFYLWRENGGYKKKLI